MATTPGNAIGETTTGIVGFTGTAFVGTAATQYDVLVGGSTSSTISNVGPGSAGQVLQSGGNAANPAYSTATYPATAGTSGNVLTSDGTNFLSQAPVSTKTYTSTMQTSSPSSPADATTYHMAQGVVLTGAGASTTNSMRYYIPFDCTINIVKANFQTNGTLGSNESGTLFLRKNDTTNTNISTSVQLTAINVAVSTTTLNLSVVAGDFLTWGFTTPTWGTNPTSVSFAGNMST